MNRLLKCIPVSVALGLLLLLAGCSPKPVQLGRTVILANFEFRPETLEVPAGAEVTLTLINNANAEHIWLLLRKEQSVSLPLDIDEANVLMRVTVDVTGRETFTVIAALLPMAFVTGLPTGFAPLGFA